MNNNSKKNIRVLIIGPAFPLRGGISDFNMALCKSFINKKIDCSILSFSMQYPKFLFPGKTQFYDEKVSKSDAEIVSLINSVNPFSWLKAIKYIKKLQPDLVITAYWMPFTGISTAFILSRIKRYFRTFALAHNINPHEKMPFSKQIASFFIKQNQAFILLSNSVSKDLDFFDDKKPRLVAFHPIYNIFGEKVGRKEALEKLNLSENYKYVLFFGLIKKYKGLNVLLKAFADERLKKDNIKLIVAGEFYEDKEKYLRLIKDYDIEDKIVLKDYFIPTNEVKYFFSAADIAVMPYLSATQSGVTQVAFHFDMPLIVTRVGGLHEVVKHGKTGYIVEPNNSNQIADVIVDFYTQNKKSEFSQEVAKEKQKFSWETFSAKILSFYKEFNA